MKHWELIILFMKPTKNYKFYLRKSHRYLGIFIGIQFLFWTVGGLYFSWTNIEEIRGEHLKKEQTTINFNREFLSPQIALNSLNQFVKSVKIKNLKLIEVSGVPFYELEVDSPNRNYFLVNALTGKVRSQFNETEAKKIALDSLKNPLKINKTELINEKNIGSHHEYREKPLPAWAITFENNLTVYLSAENGKVGAYRTNKWRIFDFLWMLHTMDFQGRDNINNIFLRTFSILGLLTILSGFILFFVSSKFFRKLLFKSREN